MREAGRGGSSLVSKLPLLQFSPNQPGARKFIWDTSTLPSSSIRTTTRPQRWMCTRLRGDRSSWVKTATGEISLPPLPTKPLHFSGYDWNVRMSSAVRGGLDNLYDGENAWVDPQGALHLRISKKGEKWTCAMVLQTRSLGYGTYAFTVHDVSQLEPAAVLSARTFDASGGDQHYREMDVEMTRWRDARRADNIRYGIMPLYLPANTA